VSLVPQIVIGRSNVRGVLGLRGLFLPSFIFNEHRAGALFQHPAREHRVGALVNPLIEQLPDFFAEIGGVSETRELVRLQCGVRGGKEKFPRGLGAELGHKNLQARKPEECDGDNNALVISTASSTGITSLWKLVEKRENALCFCSGCAGDYEDPDWTAWEEDSEEADEGSKRGDFHGGRSHE
jgi:hypothetical protein